MPVHLRKFYYTKLAEIRQRENDAVSGKSSSAARIAKPNISPKQGKVSFK